MPQVSFEGEEAAGRRRFWMIATVALIVLGFGCRLRQYFVRTSFWNDEAFIVLNITDHSWRQLMGPLDYNQAAPPGFLWVERAAARTLGTGELSLRLFPLLGGLAALVVFAIAMWRAFPPAVATFGVGWFAFAQRFVIYSAEVKQYSTDALVAVLLMLWTIGVVRSERRGRAFLLMSVAAAGMVWFSHPTAILFAASSLTLLFFCRTRGEWAGWLVGNAAFAISFVALHRLSISREQNPFLYTFWASGFPPGGVRGDAVWLGVQLWDYLRQPFPLVVGLTAALAVLGTVELIFSRKWVLLSLALLPVALTIGAAFRLRYPFSPSRLTIFLLPGTLLLCTAGAEFMRVRTDRVLRVCWCVLPGVLLGYAAVNAGQRVIRPHFHSHVRPAVEYVRAHRKLGDTIYFVGEVPDHPTPGQPVHHLEYLCYWRRPDPPYATSLPPADELPDRFWIVYPITVGHDDHFARPLLDEARSVATEKDRLIVKQGGAAYLFVRNRQG